MRQLVTVAPGRVELRDIADPVPEPDEALLAVEAVGICGSDVHFFTGDHPYSRFPNVQGHEFGGRVLALPAGYAGPVRVGQRVAVEPLLTCGVCLPCRRDRSNCCVAMRTYGAQIDGALSDRIAVKAHLLHDAEGLPADLLPLAETMSIALQGLARAAVREEDSLVVFGAGPIGMSVLIAATALGARVMLVDTLESRLRLGSGLGAERMAQAGAEDVAAAIAEWTGGEGPTVVVEATGVPRVLEQAVQVVAPSGTVLVIGLSRDEVRFPMVELTRKELTIAGSRNSVGRFGAAVALVHRERERIEQLISHRVPLEQGGLALRLAHDAPGEVEKIIIEVSTDPERG